MASSLENTPTYAVASVIGVFFGVSLAFERSLHYLGRWLRRRKQKALFNALERMKQELMLVGFITLLLDILEPLLLKICVTGHRKKFLPCAYTPTNETPSSSTDSSAVHGRRLLSAASQWLRGHGQPSGHRQMLRRLLLESTNSCPSGQEPFVGAATLKQLHNFVFILAVTHIIYSCITMFLALLKVQSWKGWEENAQHFVESFMQLDPEERARLKKMKPVSTFVRRHAKPLGGLAVQEKRARDSVVPEESDWEASEKQGTVFLWLVCILRQFWSAIRPSDYYTLRAAFITTHGLSQTFNFHAYLVRSLEVDFIRVVGFSWYMFVLVVLFLLFNLSGWNFYFWIDFLPCVLAVLIGAKLVHVLATLAIEIAHTPGGCAGEMLQIRDSLFWFSRPSFILDLVHYMLFQNAFEVAVFLWFLYEFGADSCLLNNSAFYIVRLVLSIVVQIFMSFITLPLYAIVAHMGSQYRHTILPEAVKMRLKSWAKRHKGRANPTPADSSRGGDTNNTEQLQEIDQRVSESDGPNPGVGPRQSQPSKILRGEESREDPGSNVVGMGASPAASRHVVFNVVESLTPDRQIMNDVERRCEEESEDGFSGNGSEDLEEEG